MGGKWVGHGRRLNMDNVTTVLGKWWVISAECTVEKVKSEFRKRAKGIERFEEGLINGESGK